MIDTKACRECGANKPIDQFYKHAKMADGHLNKCKSCVKERVRSHREGNIEKVRAYDRERAVLPHRRDAQREYQRTESGKASLARSRARYREKHPERRAAHIMVGNAIRDGKLQKHPCHCGSTFVEAHHYDYSRPLDVIWLCRTHHIEIHRDGQ